MVLFRRGVHFGSYGRVDDGPGVFDRLLTSVQAAEESGFDALSVPVRQPGRPLRSTKTRCLRRRGGSGLRS